MLERHAAAVEEISAQSELPLLDGISAEASVFCLEWTVIVSVGENTILLVMSDAHSLGWFADGLLLDSDAMLEVWIKLRQSDVQSGDDAPIVAESVVFSATGCVFIDVTVQDSL